MLRQNRTVKALTRLGAIGALIVYLFSGLGPALRYGHSIGHFMNEALADTPLAGSAGEKLLSAFGSFLGGLAGLMVFVLIGALVGTAAGAILVRYITGPARRPVGDDRTGGGS